MGGSSRKCEFSENYKMGQIIFPENKRADKFNLIKPPKPKDVYDNNNEIENKENKDEDLNIIESNENRT